MAQLDFPGVPIGIKGNRRRKLLNPSETARNIRTRSWMADIESAKPIEINTIAARASELETSSFSFLSRVPQVTWKSISRVAYIPRAVSLRDLDSRTISRRRASPDLNESLATLERDATQ